jgi:hypothetical protein
MKKVSIKALMVLTLMVASFAATPMMVAGYDNDYGFDQFGTTDPSDIVTGFSGGFGSIFRGLGYGGNLLATVFDLLFMQVLTNFSGKEVLPGVYVLSAFNESTVTDERNFGMGEKEIHMAPYEYYEGAENLTQHGYAYCEVTKSGTYNFTLTYGAGVTLVIWDNDNSFVNAVKKIIAFFHSVRPYINNPTEGEIPEELIREGVELITWFLIHINDIFTGEELFVLNPITWQKLTIDPDPSFEIQKEWKVTEDWVIGNGDDIEIKSMTMGSHNISGPALLEAWNDTAKAKNDSYMQWLLTETEDIPLLETIFTSFTFDLIQFWVKNFEIHIDVGAIMDMMSEPSGPVNPAAIFQGLDIEFYLFTHHLAGTFLYNDTNSDNKLSADYIQVNNTDGDPILLDGETIDVPHSSELTHRLILGKVGDFDFELPTKVGKKISWGLTMNQATLVPVPVGVDLDSYLGASKENLAYIHFGFTFEPKFLTMTAEDGTSVPVLHGAVKLDQEFAPWNNESSPYHAKSPIEGLDLAIIYVSTVLHFHLTVDTLGADPTEWDHPADDYSNVTHSLKIGNYLGKNIAGKLDFVDIAGPEYFYGAEGSTDKANATTNILPVALFEVEVDKHETYEGTPGEVETFAADIRLNVSFNVMVYAVCFPMFEDGTGIWHDPTFSVFMVFEAKGFWALILLIAGVGFVGIATILIKRRKDMRF